MAVCDAQYCFTLVNVSDFGSNNDSGILAKSSMEKQFEEQKIKITSAKPLLGYKENFPYFVVGDEVFPLKMWLMGPYPGTLSLAKKAFKYRLSGAIVQELVTDLLNPFFIKGFIDSVSKSGKMH